jgi:hypothetical protein
MCDANETKMAVSYENDEKHMKYSPLQPPMPEFPPFPPLPIMANLPRNMQIRMGRMMLHRPTYEVSGKMPSESNWSCLRDFQKHKIEFA